MSDLSAYERAREAQIARNKEEIERLGLAASRRRAREQAAKAAKAAKADPPASSTVSFGTHASGRRTAKRNLWRKVLGQTESGRQDHRLHP